jgi:Tfp pilus tip-associated adhesin PilY1
MKIFRTVLSCMMLSLAGMSSSLHAEDIDIYSNSASTSGVPNVLLVLDNAANFSASASNCTYVDGTAPSLNGTAGGIEQCAIYNVISALPAGAVNLGLMAYNANNMRDINNANCGGSNGGCLAQPLALMTGTAKSNFLAWIKTWKTTGGAGSGYIKANGQATAATMQEAWAYYAGQTGLSGRSYSGVQPPAGCQKNFVIFIGNALTTSGSPGDGGGASPMAALAAAPGVTAAQIAPITMPSGSYGTSNFSCGTYSMGSHTDPSGLYADEWARYMFQTDIYGSLADSQGITTYTVGLLGSSCKPDFPALLSSMASVGGGKYFPTSSYDEIATAILKILNEIQAINSVFASASLPVSVNAQGTYLNQIFFGMFRPDAGANPRWLGNLKQYKFVLEYPDPSKPDPSTATLKLSDSTGTSAISGGTGFIAPGAISYWTEKNILVQPDSGGGFFVKDKHGSGGGFDSPDGEMVEKGGAAQGLRRASLRADFASTAGSASNPRRLYTYCPSGSSCNASLTDASNVFSVENAGISASAFGGSTRIPVLSIVRTGSSALVTTSGNHGFSVGTRVTVSNVTESPYNVTQAISALLTATTFTITGLPDSPTTPSQGAYTVASVGGAPVKVVSMTRTAQATGGNNTETVTVQTSGHSFTAGSQVVIADATPGNYNGSFAIGSPTATNFTFSIPIYPTTPAANSYTATIFPYSRTIVSAVFNKTAKSVLVTTAAAHGFHDGQTVVISGTGITSYDGSQVITFVSATQFSFTVNGNPKDGGTGSVQPSSTAQTVLRISRAGTTDSTTATATGAPANWFGNAIGDTNVVSITTSGTAPNEDAYNLNQVTITCANVACTSFTYPVTVSPGTVIGGVAMTATLQGTSSVNIPAGAISRSGTTATVSGLPASQFLTGQQVNISASDPAYGTESAYAGRWTLSCSGTCTTATFGPVALTPVIREDITTSPNMQVYSGATPPDKATLIKWVRGADNMGDELSPGGGITVRPSIHGDVLHSRPVVINYGDSRGVVVYYGSNEGVFHAVNGSQADALGTVPAGGELWGLVLPEFFNKLNRQRINSPELKMPSTRVADAESKDYFVDGATGFYQKLKADGTVDKAYLYLTMRRGGRFMYALDVSDPVNPKFLWKISSATSGFSELGQTWSRPRVTLVSGYANPVLVFGAGYDPAEDAEPPTADTIGRGIFVVDAATGVQVWKATYTAGSSSCSGSSIQAACSVSGMNWAIPADINFLDRDNDGKTDRFYAADLGGGVWRVDLEPTAGNTPDKWQVSQLAAVGCSAGNCATGTTPRKFFFPPNVLSIGPSGGSSSYDQVMLGSGDREHPLLNTAAGSSYGVTNRFYVLKDPKTGKDAKAPTATPVITESALFDATTTSYDKSLSGFYRTFATGEKAVNASITAKGRTYYGTNQPVLPNSQSCKANLGTAKGYSLDPFSGTVRTTVYDGGGLPPSAITGIVTIGINDSGDSVKKEFCMGCGGSSASPLEGEKLTNTVPKNLRRTYWYKK